MGASEDLNTAVTSALGIAVTTGMAKFTLKSLDKIGKTARRRKKKKKKGGRLKCIM